MWQAIRNATRLVKPEACSLLQYITELADLLVLTRMVELKRIYNNSSRVVKTLIEYSFISLIVLKMLLTFKNQYLK